jgi:hypothetical protein
MHSSCIYCSGKRAHAKNALHRKKKRQKTRAIALEKLDKTRQKPYIAGWRF